MLKDDLKEIKRECQTDLKYRQELVRLRTDGTNRDNLFRGMGKSK